MLKEKYEGVLKLGELLKVQDGYVEEKDGKLHIGGVATYAGDKDQLWDKIKTYPNWESEILADIKVANHDIYGHYTVRPGDTLSKIAKLHLGKASAYMKIFELNRDILDNPNLIKVGQKLKLPPKPGNA